MSFSLSYGHGYFSQYLVEVAELEGFGLVAGLPLGCGGTVYTSVYTCQPLRLTGSVCIPFR